MISKTKILALLVAASMTTACATKTLEPVRTEYKVVVPEESYFVCDRVALPDPNTMTDSQIASLINDLVRANKVCYNNMNAIKQYLKAAKDILETRNSSTK